MLQIVPSLAPGSLHCTKLENKYIKMMNWGKRKQEGEALSYWRGEGTEG
jgi:hypothetical protein